MTAADSYTSGLVFNSQVPFLSTVRRVAYTEPNKRKRAAQKNMHAWKTPGRRRWLRADPDVYACCCGETKRELPRRVAERLVNNDCVPQIGSTRLLGCVCLPIQMQFRSLVHRYTCTGHIKDICAAGGGRARTWLLDYSKSVSVGNRGSGASQPQFPTFSKKPAKFSSRRYAAQREFRSVSNHSQFLCSIPSAEFPKAGF